MSKFFLILEFLKNLFSLIKEIFVKSLQEKKEEDLKKILDEKENFKKTNRPAD